MWLDREEVCYLGDLMVIIITRRDYTVCRFARCVESCKEVSNDVVIELENGLDKVNTRNSIIITSRPEKYGLKIVRESIGRLVIGSKVLNSLITLYEVENGKVVLRNDHNVGVGVEVENNVIISARPLNLYLNHYPKLLIEELSIIQNLMHGSNFNNIIDTIVNTVLNERRSRKISSIIAILEEICSGNYEFIEKLPTHILDLLYSYGVVMNNKIKREILQKIINEVKSRVYPM